MTDCKIILASASPRRHEILENAKIAHTVIKTDADEALPEGISPQDAVILLSKRKADAALSQHSPDGSFILLACDTVVWDGKHILGKPASICEAEKTLSALSGTSHSVFTGITVTNGINTVSDCVATTVKMRQLRDGEIKSYVERFAPLDKAGSYGIQDGAACFVSEIIGDYQNVVGLPLCRFCEICHDDFGIDLV